MKCPIDSTELQMTERQGVEIDYCPTCRGVWLDRGELDKIIDRSASIDSRPANTPPPQQQVPHREYQQKHHKKESFLSDLFDF